MSLLHALPLLIGGVTEPPLYIGLTATFLGALSGSIFSGERKFPITGVLAIAISVGLGGGIIRDMLLGVVPVAFTSVWYLPTAIAAAFLGFFFGSLVKLGNILILVLDPIWMALFAVIGAQKALNADLSPFAAMFIGCVTAFGGGVLRDLLSHEKPELVKPGPINYAAAMLGSYLIQANMRNSGEYAQQVGNVKSILDQARAIDGSEAIPSVDHIPDWLVARQTTGNLGWGGWNQAGAPGNYGALGGWDSVQFADGLRYRSATTPRGVFGHHPDTRAHRRVKRPCF